MDLPIVAVREDRFALHGRTRPLAACLLVSMTLLSACSSTRSDRQWSSHLQQQKTFSLTKISAEQARELLAKLDLRTVALPSKPNAISVSGSADELRRAGIVLGLADANEPYVVEVLAPASVARALPSNERIAEYLGNIAVGTFAIPPKGKGQAGAIVDIHKDSVVAVAPARLCRDLAALVRFGPEGLRQVREEAQSRPVPGPSAVAAQQAGNPTEKLNSRMAQSAKVPPVSSPAEPVVQAAVPAEKSQSQAVEGANTSVSRVSTEAADTVGPTPSAALGDEQSFALSGVLRSSRRTEIVRPVNDMDMAVPLDNGDDVLELSLPEKIELVQLLDLAGEYLHLDCVYEPEKVGNQTITLKLHSKMRTELKVRDLYSLLKTVLKFKGLVMTRREGNLVTIVPAAEALDADPQIIDPNTATLHAGDMVVTRVFELQYVDVASVTNLLQSMKLSIAASPIPETQTLFVTCYAHRMERVEQLVNMIDRPGRPKEYRFRQLKHTAAVALAHKILALAQELEGIVINVGSTEKDPPGAAARPAGRPQGAAGPQGTPAMAREAVYLDTDERTNRLLMIGCAEQLETVEGLIDTLDVPDQRSIRVYEIKNVKAQEVLTKLMELGAIGEAARAAKPAAAAMATSREGPRVVLMEATNSLLVEGTSEQHDQVRAVIGYIDVAPEDHRTLKVYTIEHLEAEEVARKLQQLNLIGPVDWPTKGPSRISPAAAPAPVAVTAAVVSREGPEENAQVVVLEATNSLLVNATETQHARIQAVIRYADAEARKESIPYEIYFLENQDPEQLAEVLGKLIQETVTNAEGKIEKTIPKTEEAVTIIPDKNTFSLIVHASRKNQDWIARLVEKLDKRRPQVLIDVTLVEITEMDAFSYDLNLIQSFPDLTATSGLTGTIIPGENPVTSSDIIERLNASGRSQFADYQSAGGQFRGFYGDKHINLLLDAMQSKNYGRVLAKPKILVNDNEPGSIKTTDTTYVTRQSSVPVSSGGAGTNATLIVTAVDYQSYEAGITLDITPHISLGDLLRLDIQLIRSDFREREDPEKPPDTTSSELKTTVFVPDGSTIILGGLLKLNQNKGGTKVPILGDLPLVGILFRSINNKDLQSKLYIFVKAEIIRPTGLLAQGMEELQTISQKNREAFEKHEQQFQKYQDVPGIEPEPVEPPKVLEAR